MTTFDSSSVIPPARRVRGHRGHRGRVALVVSLIACGLVASAAPAVAVVPVVDAPHTIKTALGWVESHRQDLREVQQWQRQVAHYRQQLTTVARYLDRSAPMSDRFESRAADHGLAEACPGAGAGGGLLPWPPLAIDPRGDVGDQQREVCRRIVLARNARYNEQARMLRRFRDNDATLRALGEARAQAGDRQGALAANDNDVARFFARAGTDLEYSRAALVAYEGYIAELEHTQARLARHALDGARGPAGAIVQGVALKAALASARGRDR